MNNSDLYNALLDMRSALQACNADKATIEQWSKK